MKKQILFVCGVVFLLGVIYFTTGTGYSSAGTPDTKNYAETEGGGGGGCTTWQRNESKCSDIENAPTKVNCLLGGIEQCTAKYCP